MKLDNGVIIDVHNRNIGPQHDPYGATTVRLQRDNIYAERYYDGLGQEHVKVWKGNDLIAERKWYHDLSASGKNKTKCNNTYAELIVRRHVGMSVHEAENAYNENWVEDPMGSLGSYM